MIIKDIMCSAWLRGNSWQVARDGDSCASFLHGRTEPVLVLFHVYELHTLGSWQLQQEHVRRVIVRCVVRHLSPSRTANAIARTIATMPRKYNPITCNIKGQTQAVEAEISFFGNGIDRPETSSISASPRKYTCSPVRSDHIINTPSNLFFMLGDDVPKLVAQVFSFFHVYRS